MASESKVISEWLSAQLAVNSTIDAYATGVYSDKAPQGTVKPYVIFVPEVGRDTQENSLGLVRCVLYRYYRVFAVDQDTGFAGMEAVATAIAGFSGSVVTSVEPRFMVEQVAEIREEVSIVGGGTNYYRGSVFRFIVQPNE